MKKRAWTAIVGKEDEIKEKRHHCANKIKVFRDFGIKITPKEKKELASRRTPGEIDTYARYIIDQQFSGNRRNM